MTSINFLPHRENLLLSSGSGNGYVGLVVSLFGICILQYVLQISRILRTWDVRYTTPTGRRRKSSAVVKSSSSADESRDLTALTVMGGNGSKTSSDLTRIVTGRTRGVGSVALNPTGSVAWALGKNGKCVPDSE